MGARLRTLTGQIALLTLLPALLALSGCWEWAVVGPIEQAPSVTLQPAAGQLNLYNTGSADLQLWGDKLEGFPTDIDEQGQVIGRDRFYNFPTDRLRAAMLSTVGHNGEKLVPFEVYLSDETGRSYVARFDLLVKMTSGNMTIHTRQVGLRLASGFRGSART
jgi:hypothetical protein